MPSIWLAANPEDFNPENPDRIKWRGGPVVENPAFTQRVTEYISTLLAHERTVANIDVASKKLVADTEAVRKQTLEIQDELSALLEESDSLDKALGVDKHAPVTSACAPMDVETLVEPRDPTKVLFRDDPKKKDRIMAVMRKGDIYKIMASSAGLEVQSVEQLFANVIDGMCVRDLYVVVAFDQRYETVRKAIVDIYGPQ